MDCYLGLEETKIVFLSSDNLKDLHDMLSHKDKKW